MPIYAYRCERCGHELDAPTAEDEAIVKGWYYEQNPTHVLGEERIEDVDPNNELSEKARADALQYLSQHKALIEDGAAQVRTMLDEARVQSQAIKDGMVKQAQQEAEAVRTRAEREIGSARDQAILELWDRAAELAVSVAGKVLPRELGEADHRRLIEGALAELPQAPVSGNGQGARA